MDGYEVEHEFPGVGQRTMRLNARQVFSDEGANTTILLGMEDITERRILEREKDELLKQKEVLLEELQHRVANSLQIIASVLIQSARKVQSEEARTSLNDAHHRVMSIATLQRQLAASDTDAVALRPYFTDLCSTIGASMIADPARLRITPTIHDAVASSEVSVSLGLIVTELIINALKHAFPETVKSGNIIVNYVSEGPAWALTVADDGVGRPEKSVPGLGTGIVDALAKQLKASVESRDAHPGTLTSIIHEGAVAR
jgi:chemotaxis protein methyltransferase CheR